MLVRRGPAVLVVDDDISVAVSVDRALTRDLGARVCAVATCAAALAELDTGLWDLLVADILLPRASHELAASGFFIIERALATGSTRVIAISGDADFALDSVGLRVPFLVKPFTTETLCSVARGLLREVQS